MIRQLLAKTLAGASLVLVPALLANAVLAAQDTRLLMVDTPSVPMGLYSARALTARAVGVGAYVCLLGSGPLAPRVLREAISSGRVAPRWRYEPLVKIVAGIEGDLVTYEHGLVHINGRPLAHSTAHETNREGERLAHAVYPRRLQEGKVWLTSVHDDGFDSRYYGPVAIAALSCIAEPVWTR